MRKLYLFMMISADGFFEGENHDLSWHNVDPEFNRFAIKQLEDTGAIVFGRRTYDLMASYWPTEKVKKQDPEVFGYMNSLPKYVCSSSLKRADWANTKIISQDFGSTIRQLKQEKGKSIAVFGSSSLSLLLMKHGLIDEFRIMVNPVFIGRGTPLFEGLEERLRMKLLRTSRFRSGNVLLRYQFTPFNSYEKDNRDGVRDD